MICLANMPFAALRKQPIAIPLISAILKDAGMDVTTSYFNFDFAAMMGISDYMRFINRQEVPLHFLQWLFAGIAWGWDSAREEEVLEKILAANNLTNESPIALQIRELRRDAVPRFMENCIEKIRRIPDLSVVGFSCLFHQIPAFAMGRMLREARPDVKLIYGGSAFHGEVGEELFDRIEWIDALSNSEADDVVAEAFRRLEAGRPLEGLQGMMHRDRTSGKIYRTPGTYVAAEVLDNGLIPDLDGYFQAAEEHGLMEFYNRKLICPELPFESSRGCWWHVKCPCTFCGLNGVSETYRTKSPENVLKTLKYYRDKFGADHFEATDNNLSMDYFDTFLPRLKEVFPEQAHVFYNIKSNLNRAQVKTLADAGITLAQPGIESLSDHVLKLMRKGVSAIQNVFLLKCARQYGVYLLWYLIQGSLGETQADCDEMTGLIPRIMHLNPPKESYWTIQVHRFSTYWRESGHYFEEIRPSWWYEWLFPEGIDLDKVAYYFDFKPLPEFDRPLEREALSAAIAEWRRRWMFDEEPRFFYRQEEERVLLFDSRSEKPVKVELEPDESAIYLMLDDPTPLRTIQERAPCSPAETLRILDDFEKYGLIMRSNNLYLGLALREGFRQWKREEKITLTLRVA